MRNQDEEYVDGELSHRHRQINWEKVRVTIACEVITILIGIAVGGVDEGNKVALFATGFQHGIVIANLCMIVFYLFYWPSSSESTETTKAKVEETETAGV